ncbi:MAG TPA: MBL fold metallo-hydrolase [Xanthobacteraceae bacterium]|jgi:metallo-beta-lactamase class B|nr:MBL fold metallo-hydrolase [Xanthobacteraceae bacterium]
MKPYRAALLAAGLMLGPQAFGQTAPDTVEAHIAAAKAAAGPHGNILQSLCLAPSAGPTTSPPARTAPERSTWHVEPVKVFDNLYFVGEKEYSSWAVTTSEGIILLDTIWDYSVEDEIVGGLKKLGLDPAQIKYALVTHGHIDHVGGAKFLQDHFGTRIILSAADWDLVEKSPRIPTKPRRDMVATDGQKLTLGDTTVTLYLTPGHTLGTVSALIPVKDNGKPHLVAEWGGTGFNFEHSRARFETYAASAARFGDIVAKSGADALIANHTNLDGSKAKLPALAARKPGEENPYVIGNGSVRGYVKVAEECARAAVLREQ